MIRRTGGGPTCHIGIAAGLAAAALAAALLLPAAPAEAGWLGRGIGVAGAARSFKRNLGEAVDLLDDTLGAAIQGDFEEVERLSGELREVPGRIITDAFPVLGIGAAALEKAEGTREWLKAAPRRVGRFVGDAVADARMALETGRYEIEAGVLDPKRPLPAVTFSGPSGTSRPAPSGSSAASTPDPWGQAPEEDEETAAGGADPWGQDPKEEETTAGEVDPPGEESRAGHEGGDVATKRLQGEYAAALDRFLSAEKGGSDYEAALSALLEREKELLAKVVGPEEQELTPHERRRVQACLAEREFDPGAADGIFGPRTRTAIRAWQATQGREQSGRLDQSSARTLLEECEVALAEAGTAAESVERKFEPKCADIFEGQSDEAIDELLDEIEVCYMEFIDKPGCHLALNKKSVEGLSTKPTVTHIDNWNHGSYGMDKLRWSGACSEGLPNGQGTLSVEVALGIVESWSLEEEEDRKWKREYTGGFTDGIPQGNWIFNELHSYKGRFTKSEIQRGIQYSMMNGQIHGKLTIYYRDTHVDKRDSQRDRDSRKSRTLCDVTTGKIVSGKYNQISISYDYSSTACSKNLPLSFPK